MRISTDISGRRLWAIVRREFNEIIRDPLYMTLALLVPAFILVTFGFGLVLDIEHVPTGVLDRDDTRLSRTYVDAVAASESFDVVQRYSDFPTMEEDLRAGRIRAAVIVPQGFERYYHHGRQGEVQFIIDGVIPVRAEITRTFAESIHQQFLGSLNEGRWHLPHLGRGSVDISARIEFNSELRSANFIVPGLIATTLMYYPALLTTLSIVREKESQTILSLYCSPISKAELLLGKLLPYLMISLVNAVVLMGLALYVFEVPFRGSLALVAFATVLYLFATCSVGMLISVLVNTQVAAILVTMVTTLLPSFLYTGFFTPLSASKWSIWLIGRFLPTTYYLDILRGVFLKGTGWSMNWPTLTTLAVYSIVLYWISFKCFSKRIR